MGSIPRTARDICRTHRPLPRLLDCPCWRSPSLLPCRHPSATGQRRSSVWRWLSWLTVPSGSCALRHAVTWRNARDGLARRAARLPHDNWRWTWAQTFPQNSSLSCSWRNRPRELQLRSSCKMLPLLPACMCFQSCWRNRPFRRQVHGCSLLSLDCIWTCTVVGEERTTRTLFVSPPVVRVQDVSGLRSYVPLASRWHGRSTHQAPNTEYQDQLPQLNGAQIVKLRHLSIVSLATERRVSIPDLRHDRLNNDVINN